MKPRQPWLVIHSKAILPLRAALILSAATLPSHAVTILWDGGGADNKFTTIANWNPDAAIAVNGNDIQFGPSARTDADVNLSGNINSWNFLSELTTPMTITASVNSMQFAAGTATPIQNNSASDQFFNCAVRQFWIGGTQTGGVANRTWSATSGAMTYNDVRFRPDSFLAAATVGGTLTFAGNFNHTVNTTIGLDGTWGTRTASLIKTGTGTLLLKGSGTFNGSTVVNAGIVRIQNSASLGTSTVSEAARTDIKTGAALELDGNLTTTEFFRAAGTGIGSTGAIRAVSGTSALTSQIAMEGVGGATVSFGVDAGAVLKVARLYSDPGRDTNFEKAGAGTLVLTADNSDEYLGTTTISDGVLQIGDAGTTGELKTSGVINNAAIAFNRINSYDYAGSIIGTGTVTQAGIGVTTLSGTHLYTGPTNVTAGTLKITGSTDPLSTVNVTGGTLSGEGVIGGNTAITGNLVGDEATGGGLTISGSFTATGPVNLALQSVSPTPGTYLIATCGSIVNPGNLTTSYRGSSVVTTATTISLNVVAAVPFTLNWSGAASAVWDSNGAVNWANPAPQKFLTGDFVTFPEGASNTSLNLTGDLRPGSIAVNSTTTPYTFAGTGAINGATALAKSGTGSLTITNANGYSGGTTLTNGRLRLGNPLALGSGPVALIGGRFSSDGATPRVVANVGLNLGNTLALGDAVENGTLTFSSPAATLISALDLTTSSDVIIQGVIGDDGNAYPLTKSGAGNLTLSSPNTFIGDVTLNAGRVRIGNNAALGLGQVTINGGVISSDGGTARTIGNSPVVIAVDPTFGNSTDNGALTFSAPFNLDANRTFTTLSPVTISGAFGGDFNLTKAGAGSLTLTNTAAYLGATTVGAGALKFQVSSGTLNAGTSVAVANGATLQLQTNSSTTATIAAPLSLDGNGTANTLEFPANNTCIYNLNGAIAVSNAPVIRCFGLINRYNINQPITGTTNASGLLFKSEGGNSTGQPHTFALNAASTYTGNTALNAISQQGILRLGVDNALPVSTSLNLIGHPSDNDSIATLELAGFNQTLTGVTSTANPSRANVSNTSTTASVLTINNPADVTMAGILGKTVVTVTGGDNFGLTKTGAGKLTLTASNTYRNYTTVADGTLAVNGVSIADTNKLTISGSGKVDLTNNETVGTLFYGTTQKAAGTYGSSASVPTPDVVDDARFSGSGILTVSLSPGYAAWASLFVAPALSASGATADPDGDGLSNAIEYVIGGDPRVNSQSGKPVSTDNGSTLTFEFDRVDSSETADTVLVVQTSADLITWTNSHIVGATTGTSSPGVTVDELGSASDHITVSIPHAPDAVKFARLSVSITP